jgi:putative DNA primase/helicase
MTFVEYTDYTPESKPPKRLIKDLPAGSDEALALAFVSRHEGELRYVAAWGKWLSYDGCRWAVDSTLHVFALVRRLCRDQALLCSNAKEASGIASGRMLSRY